MAITTMDGVFAGIKTPTIGFKSVTSNTKGEQWKSLWSFAGNPGAGTTTGGAAGAALTNSSYVAGSIMRSDPASGNAYVHNLGAGFAGSGNFGGRVMLLDRLWQSGAISVAAGTTSFTGTTAISSRPDGTGCFAMMETVAAGIATACTATLTYKDMSAASSTTVTSFSTTADGAGDAYIFPLESGDTGITEMTSIQFSASRSTQTVQLSVVRPIAIFATDRASFSVNDPNWMGFARADIMSGAGGRIYDDSVLFFATISNYAYSAGTTSWWFMQETHG